MKKAQLFIQTELSTGHFFCILTIIFLFTAYLIEVPKIMNKTQGSMSIEESF